MIRTLLFMIGSIALLGAAGKKQENSYLACGCGCCPETMQKPVEKCVDKKAGETLASIKKVDSVKRLEKDCALAGCAQAILYKVCD